MLVIQMHVFQVFSTGMLLVLKREEKRRTTRIFREITLTLFAGGRSAAECGAHGVIASRFPGKQEHISRVINKSTLIG